MENTGDEFTGDQVLVDEESVGKDDIDESLRPIRTSYIQRRSITIPEDVVLQDGFSDEEMSAMNHLSSSYDAGIASARQRLNRHEISQRRSSGGLAPSSLTSSGKKKLSLASSAVDFGNKGYLTDLELKLRSYDEDGDGKFSKGEVLKIVQDLETEKSKSRGYRRTICGIGALVVILLLTVFGLMVGTVYLTRLVGTGGNGEVLVNAKTKQTLKTKSIATALIVEQEPNILEDDEEEERILALSEIGRNFMGFINKAKWEEAYGDLQDGNFVNLQFTSSNDVVHIQNVSDTEGLTISETVSFYRSSDTVQVNFETADNPSYRIRGLYEETSCAEDATTICKIYHHVDCPSGDEAGLRCELYETLPFVPVVSGVNATSAVIWFKADSETHVSVKISTGQMFLNAGTTYFPNDGSGSVLVSDATDFTGTITVSGLTASTKYYYKVMFDGYEVDTGYTEYFKTFPDMSDSNDPSYPQIKFTVFSDAAFYRLDQGAPAYRSGGNKENEDDFLFAMQIGDFDHSDPTSLDEMRLMHGLLRDPTRRHGSMLASHILTRMAFIHMWDDHDYCGQDTDKTCPIKSEAFQAFKEYYPNYEYSSNVGFWFSFEAGFAEIFVLDTRSQRDPDILPDPQDGTSTKSMLDGDEIADDQITWLKNGLTNSVKPWKIIISTVSANMQARPTNIDHWMSFRSEATMLRDWIAAQPGLVQGSLRDEILFISGDLHSGGAIDDGCNNGFNLAELAVAHTNLVKGNQGKLGEWTEGVTDGSTAGFGRVTVEETALTAEAIDEDGNVMYSLTLPHPATAGCPDKDYNTTFIECSYNLHYFKAPENKGRCINLTREVWTTYPFMDDDGNLLENNVTWYECYETGRRIMVSNDIPDHDIIRYNSYEPCERFWYVDMPMEPEIMDNGLFEPSHIMGFSLNGVVAYGPLELSSQNAIELEELNDPNATQIKDARYWFGHNGVSNIWHYHHPFLGIDNATVTLTSVDHIGYAMDGFPIYGPLDDPDSVLDACNFDQVNKRYHIRLLDQVNEALPYCNDIQQEVINWKYIIGCHVGNPRLTNVMESTEAEAIIYDDCQVVTYP